MPITREVPIQECLNGKTREECSLDDDAIEDFVKWTKEIKSDTNAADSVKKSR